MMSIGSISNERLAFVLRLPEGDRTRDFTGAPSGALNVGSYNNLLIGSVTIVPAETALNLHGLGKTTFHHEVATEGSADLCQASTKRGKPARPWELLQREGHGGGRQDLV
jgi:hypothetical protein